MVALAVALIGTLTCLALVLLSYRRTRKVLISLQRGQEQLQQPQQKQQQQPQQQQLKTILEGDATSKEMAEDDKLMA